MAIANTRLKQCHIFALFVFKNLELLDSIELIFSGMMVMIK